MEKLKFAVVACDMMRKRRKTEINILRQRYLNSFKAYEKKSRRRRYISQNKQQYMLSIVAILAKQRKERSCHSRPRSNHFWTLLKEPQNVQNFYEHFRMSKASFEILCSLLEPHMPKQIIFLTIPVPMDKQIAIGLYKLASCAEYRVVGDVFGVHKSTVHKYFYIVINAIVKLTKEYIKFPSLEESLEIAKRFERKSYIPNIIGAIDGTHIPVLPPSNGYLDFVNRKGWPSMVMQAVVDDKYLFRDVSMKFPGSVHDATVFKESGLYKNASKLISPYGSLLKGVNIPLMLVGDPAYPLLPWLLKPYTGSLNVSEESFNCYLSSARMCVENAFGRLKGRWKCLSKRLDISTKFIPQVVLASAVLHNFCETQKEPYNAAWEQQGSDFVGVQPNAMPSHQTGRNQQVDPKVVRDVIKLYLEENFELRRSSFQRSS